MPKPIFLVGLPCDLTNPKFTTQELINFTENLNSKFKGYHCVVYFTEQKEMQFRVLSEKGFAGADHDAKARSKFNLYLDTLKNPFGKP